MQLTEGEPAPEITVAHGEISPVEGGEGGRYAATVTPDRTGELHFTVRAGEAVFERAALVLPEVAEGWGQPMMVSGLVNTEGYEDGVTVSPDDAYLFVQTGPMYFSGLLLFQFPRAQGGCGGDRLSPTRCDHPWVNQTIGSYGPPARPGFYDGRIGDDGSLLHNSNLYQVPNEVSPILAPITMFYGFARQPDGTFAEPFILSFEDANDAIVNPFGMSFQPHRDNTATMLFALNDPAGETPGVDLDGDGTADVPSGFDVFTTEVSLGADHALGRYVPGPNPLEIERADFPPQLVELGAAGTEGRFGTQGNPHLYYDEGGIRSVWTDDEYDTDPESPAAVDHGDLSVYVLDGVWPEGPFTKVVLPDPISTEAEEIQPFFDGERLVYTRETEIWLSRYSGPHTAAGYSDGASWGAPTPILRKDTAQSDGAVIAIGEPTMSVDAEGVRRLYFVYGAIRGFDPISGFPDINMQAGYVLAPAE